MADQELQIAGLSEPEEGSVSHLQFPLGYWAMSAFVTLLVVSQVVLLGLVLKTMGTLNDSLDKTNQQMTGLQTTIEPVATQSKPFLKQGPPFLTSTEDDLGRMLDMVGRMDPAVQSMSYSAVPVLQDLGSSDLKGAVNGASRASAVFQDLVSRGQLVSTFTLLREQLADASNLGLVSDLDANLGLMPGLVRTMDGMVRTMDEMLTIMNSLRTSATTSIQMQRITKRQLDESLAIQREGLEHLRSIDRRTGGGVVPRGGG